MMTMILAPMLEALWAPKLFQNVSNNFLKSGPFSDFIFFQVSELFRCLLGASLGLPRLFWTALDSGNLKQPNVFLRFSQIQVFGTWKLLIALLGLSWPLLGGSGSKMGPQNGPKCHQKVVQELVKNKSNCWVRFRTCFWEAVDPDTGGLSLGRALGTASRAWSS